MKNDLKELSNPKKYNNPISINNQDADTLKKMLSAMLLIRKTEQQSALGKKNNLIGGLYGLRVGSLFGAESMFHFRSDASKVALVALTQYAQDSGIKLIDVQVQNAHLSSMGICEISRENYCRLAYQLTGEVNS